MEIKDVKERDKAYSKNLETNKIEIKQVVRTFKKETNKIIKIRVNGENKIYVKNKGFVIAEKIKKGDILISRKGIEKVEATEKEEV